MLTKNGIAYDLSKSPYIYKTGELCLHFSSEFYKSKFIEELSSAICNINNSISNRFHMNIDVKPIAILKLYSSIEKRGFLISTISGVCFNCINQIQLGGLKIKEKN